jgi:hypothetical protein
MAEIVFGMAAPHSGILGQPPEEWSEDGLRDRAKDELLSRNRTWTFPELATEREGETLLTIEECNAISPKRCIAALEEMRCYRTEAGTGGAWRLWIGLSVQQWRKKSAGVDL